MPPRRLLWSAFFLAVATISAGPTLSADEPRVTVAAILATDRNEEVDDKLKAIAEEIRKHEPDLKGFRLKRTTCKTVPVGNTESFALVDDETISVKVQEIAEKEGRFYLVVKPPLVGEITYSTSPDKFFPIVTRYQTKDKDRLIVAIMITTKPAKK